MADKEKKDSARLAWDTKPRRAPNPKDIEFQTAELVIPNPQYKDDLPLSFRDGLFGEEELDKQKMNRLIWCEQASTVSPPDNFKQAQAWEYLLLSEGLFKNNQGLGFGALVPLCRGLRDKIIAQAENKLFLI